MTRFDRRALFASGAAAALLAASGVSASPQRGGRLRAALSPALFERAVAAKVFEGLTEIAADGTLRAALATEWYAESNARRWRFALQDGVRFHDGAPFTAADLRDLPGTVRVLAPLEIELTLDAPNPNLPYDLAHPGHEVRSATGAGTGLYRVRKHDAGRHFIGDRVADHRRADAGWFDSVEFVQFEAETVRSQALREGLVDVADVTSLDALQNLQDFHALPSKAHVSHIASRSVAVPLTVGGVWPLDNLRMAERWWMG